MRTSPLPSLRSECTATQEKTKCTKTQMIQIGQFSNQQPAAAVSCRLRAKKICLKKTIHGTKKQHLSSAVPSWSYCVCIVSVHLRTTANCTSVDNYWMMPDGVTKTRRSEMKAGCFLFVVHKRSSLSKSTPHHCFTSTRLLLLHYAKDSAPFFVAVAVERIPKSVETTDVYCQPTYAARSTLPVGRAPNACVL